MERRVEDPPWRNAKEAAEEFNLATDDKQMDTEQRIRFDKLTAGRPAARRLELNRRETNETNETIFAFSRLSYIALGLTYLLHK